MNQINPTPDETQDEKPLDPAVERVRAKMVRLLAVSMGIMFVSIFAVLAAVIYRINADSTDVFQSAEIALPAGFSVLESGVDDDTVFLRGETAEGDAKMLIFNAVTGNLLRELMLRDDVSVPTDQ
ncbi:MAG: hypothetical protein AAFY99_09005 [Pseudomonadota bacterium]